MSELQTRIMCESCDLNREAEYRDEYEGNVCGPCYWASQEDREKEHTCDECGKIVEHHYRLEGVSDSVKMCEECIENVDIPAKNKEVRTKGWDKILYEVHPYNLPYYTRQADNLDISPVSEVLNGREMDYRLERYAREFKTYVAEGNAGTAAFVLKDIRQYVKDQLG